MYSDFFSGRKLKFLIFVSVAAFAVAGLNVNAESGPIQDIDTKHQLAVNS
jgi:hypothetical protein